MTTLTAKRALKPIPDWGLRRQTLVAVSTGPVGHRYPLPFRAVGRVVRESHATPLTSTWIGRFAPRPTGSTAGAVAAAQRSGFALRPDLLDQRRARAQELLALAARVYAGLSDAEVAELEAEVTDRTRWEMPGE